MNSNGAPSDPQLIFALDRAWIWKQAHRTMGEVGYSSPDPNDVLNLAEFMAGDHISGDNFLPSPIQEVEDDEDSDAPE